MKITRLLLAAAATLMLTTSCEALLDSLAKNPIFTFTDSTVCDGQSAYLGLTATCKVGWKTNRPDIVTLEYDADGHECVGTFILPSGAKQVTEVTITTTNLDDSTVDPYVGTVTVAPWKLALYKQNGENWVLQTGTADSYSWTKIGNGKYKVQMQYLEGSEYKDITGIPYRVGTLESNKVKWQGGSLVSSIEKEEYSQEFELTAKPSSSTTIKATLGPVEHTLVITQ